MRSFLLGMQFLTRIPVRTANIQEQDLVKSVIWFPYIGLILGLLYAGVSFLLFSFFPPHLAALLMTVVTVAATGGLHLDGLMDTADGLLSGRSRERMLEIMKDSRVGAMGAIALVVVYTAKWALFEEWNSSMLWTLILMPAFGRWAMVLLISWFPYAREEGMGKIFAGKVGFSYVFTSGLFLVLPIWVWKWWSLTIILFFLLTVRFIGCLWSKKLGGLTGDTYGAICELQEVFLLLMVEVIHKWM